jgi:hypothetical protein
MIVKTPLITLLPIVLAVACTGVFSSALADQPEMTFFITSEGPGDGANLGGIDGADEHCADLADDGGSTLTNWKAYLSVAPRIDPAASLRLFRVLTHAIASAVDHGTIPKAF